jgi:acyl-CoA synthetase (AMP-forming)/AMP-acid ligase II
MAALRVHPGAVGYVHPGVEVQVVDEDDVPLPPGTEGILRVRSENCVEQYFGDATGSASVFKGGWFYPGDVGSVSREGLLSVAGRTNELINHGGLQVNPHVIEDVLLSFEGIGEAAAFGAPDAMGITQIWAAIVPKKPVDSAAVFAHCSERLAESTPRFIIQMKSLPRNDAGKILRNELSKTAASADPDKIVAV